MYVLIKKSKKPFIINLRSKCPTLFLQCFLRSINEFGRINVNLRVVNTGQYRHSTGLCRSVQFVEYQHRPVEWCSGPSPTGLRLIPVRGGWISFVRDGLGRSVLVLVLVLLPVTVTVTKTVRATVPAPTIVLLWRLRKMYYSPNSTYKTIHTRRKLT